MKLYKGFDKDMKCLGFQFEEGQTYTHDGTPKLCNEGFHACELPLDCLRYYKPSDGSLYREVEMDGVTDERESDSKRVGKVIKIGARISIREIINISIDFFKKKTKNSPAATSGYRSTAATSGNWSTAATSGNWSTAATSGYRSTAATSGNWSTAATSGSESTAATSGYRSTAIVEGKESVAVVTGKDSKAKGALGCWLVLTERGEWNGETYPIIEVRAVKVDGVKILPDTFYALKGGKVVVCD